MFHQQKHLMVFTHTIHVWYIYLHLSKIQPNVGRYTIHGWYGLYVLISIPPHENPCYLQQNKTGFQLSRSCNGDRWPQHLRPRWVLGGLRRAIVGWQNIKLPTFELVNAGFLNHQQHHSRKLTAKAPENGWLEDEYTKTAWWVLKYLFIFTVAWGNDPI